MGHSDEQATTTTTTLVYQLGLRSPTLAIGIVEAQLHAALTYRRLLTAIERGRRWAIRRIDDTPEVRDAIVALESASKPERKAARKMLTAARKAARATPEAVERLVEIDVLDRQIGKQAYASSTAYWGTQLVIMRSMEQVRKMPLYERDMITPSDPSMPRWGHGRSGPDGLLGVQLQGGLSVGALSACIDRRAYLRIDSTTSNGTGYGVLGLRVGSEGRNPVWAEWPCRVPRGGIPANGNAKWITVTRRHERVDNQVRPTWMAHVTVELDTQMETRTRRHARRPSASEGVCAIELSWHEHGETIQVGRTLDDRGQSDIVLVPSSTVTRIRKAEDIRSLRDTMRSATLARFVDVLRRDRLIDSSPWPRWLIAALEADTWKSPRMLHDLVYRWRTEKCDAGRTLIDPPLDRMDRMPWHARGQWFDLPGGGTAYDLLQAWEFRDAHLWSYEAGHRSHALAHRRDAYRVLARRLRERYAILVVPDRDLSREARFGDDSDRRFTAGPSELRDAIQQVFGPRAISLAWTDDAPESAGSTWIERAVSHGAAWAARVGAGALDIKKRRSNAWAARKEAKRVRQQESRPLETRDSTHADTK